ncbi:MAG: hypothetical protein ABI654_07005 [Betaproteobacteria bacterium]
MTTMFWLLLIVIGAGLAFFVRHNLRKWNERKLAEEERFKAFMKGAQGAAPTNEPAAAPTPALASAAPPPPASSGLAQQKMLFEAAHKAGEAGEPALAIQLYGRLMARYPATAFAGQVRVAVEVLKKKLKA